MAVVLLVQAVVQLQIVQHLVVVLVVLEVVRVHQLVGAELHLVEVVRLVLAVVLRRVVVLVAGNVVVRAKKLEGNVVKSLKSNFRRRQQVIRRVRVLSLKGSLLLSAAVRHKSSLRN